MHDDDGKLPCFMEAGDDKTIGVMFSHRNPPGPRPPIRGVPRRKAAYNKMCRTSITRADVMAGDFRDALTSPARVHRH